ncbi:MAG: hypothetical protein PWQ91_69 [Eubacteriales bacterium]|nr:hypothetical protein [Eubacteriales bacterium]MDN5363008.1 hypothetical protein [Eubacteriales bacterium]
MENFSREIEREIIMEKLRTLEERVRYLEERVPRTNVLSPDFLKRAFAIYGHFWFSHLLVMVGLFGLAVFLTVLSELN